MISEAKLKILKETTSSIQAPWISEVVLQTNQFDTLKNWYPAVLGVDWFFENTPKPATKIENQHGDGGKQVHASNVRVCFMRLPISGTASMVLGLFELPAITDRDAGLTSPGLNHMQFKNTDLETLVTRVEALKEAGMDPHRSANHGPMTSFYFRDPDGNILEFCIDNFDTKEEMQAFIASEKFQKNPSGIDIDRDDFIARYRSGVAKEELLRL